MLFKFIPLSFSFLELSSLSYVPLIALFAMAQQTHRCLHCDLPWAVEHGRLRGVNGQSFECFGCSAVSKALRRNLGEFPPEDKDFSREEYVNFFQKSHKNKEAAGGNVAWTTVRAALTDAMTSQKITSSRNEVKGKALPLSVWLAQGFTEDVVRAQGSHQDPNLGEVFTVPVQAFTYAEEHKRIEENILARERLAAAKKKKASKGKNGDNALDLPLVGTAAETDGAEATAAKEAKQLQQSNEKANNLAAKSLASLTPAMTQGENLLSKLPEAEPDSDSGAIRKTLHEHVTKAKQWCQSARLHMQSWEMQKEAFRTEALEPLPFGAADVKTLVQQISATCKAARTALPKAKAKVQAAPKGKAKVAPKRKAEDADGVAAAAAAAAGAKPAADAACPPARRRKSSKQSE